MPAILIYDRACGFCTRWVRRWKARTGRKVLYLPLQTPLVPGLLGVSKRKARRAMQLVEGRRITTGARAVMRVLTRVPGQRLLARIGLIPGIRHLLELGYQVVARNRVAAARIDRLLVGRGTQPLRYRFIRWGFLRGLGLVYLVAFTSLRLQVRGLYGERGILPMKEYLDAGRAQIPQWSKRLRLIPSLFWWDASDGALLRAARAGQIAALLLVFNVLPMGSALAAWALYLSFVSAGRDFLGFQWDVLLLESGAHALAVAPGGIRPRLGDAGPSWHALALMRFLAFRFHLEAGLSKLQSGDPVWKERRTLEYHYETQPLPTRIGWYAHHLPKRVQRLGTQAALGIEVFSPFLLFLPRRARRLAFWAQGLLQGVIALTGNYGFFNLLTMVVSLWMLDDEPFERRWGRARALPQPAWSRRARILLEVPLATLGAIELFMRFRPLPERLRTVLRHTLPFGLPGSYGLFANMTITRPEIVIEGTADGVEWKEYGFRYKPGPLGQPPRQVAPHQPRLDWQMWFAALGQPPRWFLTLLVRLLQGSPEVLALFETVPFPDEPPKAVRARFYVYKIADLETHRRTGEWWTREPIGMYFPAIALQEETEQAAEEAPRDIAREDLPEQHT